MGMNCMGTPGAGTMRGMGGSMPRHRQLMMGGVPEPYASMANPLPGTAPVIARGRAVFEQSCASCHGAEGWGNGEAGRELSPPPADLAMLVRMPMMRDDRYLFWAICEGGAAFGTAMPAFKDSLSDEEIWSVIRFLQGGLPPK
jgi:mono/diheme cytochrome c family protein